MDIVVELRKLEGINTSFDYGVEIVVMEVKSNPSLENFNSKMSIVEMELDNLFEYDKIVKRGYDVAKEFVEEEIMFFERYLDFIREFAYDESVYAMKSEPKIVLFTKGRGKIWRDREIKHMFELLQNNGFACDFENLRNGDVEFRVMRKA